MKTMSSTVPEKFWIQNVRQGMATVRLRNDINKIIRNEEEVYEYDELTINIPYRDGLEDYLDTYFDELYSIALEKLKKEKIEYLRKCCQEDILNGFTAIVRGVDYHFSFDQEAQSNFSSTVLGLTTGLLESPPEWTVKENGQYKRIQMTKDEFLPIAKKGFLTVDEKVSKLRNVLIPLVENATSKSEIEDINW